MVTDRADFQGVVLSFDIILQEMLSFSGDGAAG